MNRLFLLLLFVLPVTASASTTIYAGKLRKVSEEREAGHPGNPKTYPVQFRIFSYQGDRFGTDPLSPFDDIDEGQGIVSGSRSIFSYSFSEVYDWKKTSCEGRFSVSVRGSTATLEIVEDCDNLWRSRSVYRGKVKRFKASAGLELGGTAVPMSPEKSKCFTVRDKASFDWFLNDVGGYLALFDLRVEPCGGGRSRSLVNIRRSVRTLYRSGVVTVRGSGRYRFSVRSTGDWGVSRRLF